MDLPVINLSDYLAVANSEVVAGLLSELCSEVSRIPKETGGLLVKDPRCSVEDNDRFIDMMERYFESPTEFKLQQERSHLHYQVGVTPEGVEVPRSLVDEEMQQKLRAMPEENRPLLPKGLDCKWLYMRNSMQSQSYLRVFLNGRIPWTAGATK